MGKNPILVLDKKIRWKDSLESILNNSLVKIFVTCYSPIILENNKNIASFFCCISCFVVAKESVVFKKDSIN